jgi:hypothetical protein
MWMPCTLSDMTYAEARDLIVESNDYWLAQDRCWKETWTSPDSTLTAEEDSVKEITKNPKLAGWL